MPRLMKLELEIQTGRVGAPGRVQISINGHVVELEELRGGTAPGEVLRGEFSPMSHVHELTLCGPERGEWEIEAISASFQCDADDPYTVRWRGATLDAHTAANLWAPRPPSSIDV